MDKWKKKFESEMEVDDADRNDERLYRVQGELKVKEENLRCSGGIEKVM